MHNFFCLLLALVSFSATSQVVNNDIAERLSLQIDSLPFHSNTTNCTVQWKCVDTKAVNGCIKFHNDQWFEFTTTQAGRYFITVTGQSCRDVRGVQITVIDGTPCQPATYQHLVCYSTGSQDDIALSLDNLQANHKYLINLDGYLNDFCGFDIAVTSGIPRFAVFSLPLEVPVTSQLKDSLAYIEWHLPDSLQDEFTEFYILKRHAAEKKSQQIIRFPAISNAYGERRDTYSYTDTLSREGTYTYKVIGTDNQQRNYLIKELAIYHSATTPPSRPEDIISIHIDARKNLNLSVLVYNAQTNELLKRGYVLTSSKKKNDVNIDISSYKQRGVHQYRIVVREIDNPQGYEKSFLFTR